MLLLLVGCMRYLLLLKKKLVLKSHLLSLRLYRA